MYHEPETAWNHLVDKLRAFILSKVHDQHIANDILQEAFIRIHAHIDQLRDETKIQSWMYQITRNLIVDHFRAKKKEVAGIDHDLELPLEEPEDNFMATALEDMAKMMKELPHEHCEALCLTELGGMSQKAYAEKLGISYTAAKSRVQRARKLLKDSLMRCCHYQFDKYGTVIGIYPVHCCCCS